MNKEEIEELKNFTIDLTDIDELALGLEVCSKKSNMVIRDFADTIIQLQQENKQLKEKLDIENINYKTLSADIGTVAEYMKLNEYAIIEEMIDRAVELVKKENIIDELEKWLEERIDMCFTTIPDYEIYITRQEEKHILQEVLDKLQELKGSDEE